MKKMRRMIPALCMLLVSAIMMTTASYAWFTMSTSASASGMSVTATASSSLLILDAKGKTLAVGDFKAADGQETLSAADVSLAPAIHDNGSLKTLTNTDAVDPSTGFLPDDVDPVYAAATENVNYYDYVVAIGSAGAALTGNLTATLTVNVTKHLHNATSIDFLVANGKTETATYVEGATINFVDKNSSNQIVVDLGERTIPLVINEEALGDYITVTMRVYFDGELPDEDENAYVRNAWMTEAPATFSVRFDIDTAASGT